MPIFKDTYDCIQYRKDNEYSRLIDNYAPFNFLSAFRPDFQFNFSPDEIFPSRQKNVPWPMSLTKYFTIDSKKLVLFHFFSSKLEIHSSNIKHSIQFALLIENLYRSTSETKPRPSFFVNSSWRAREEEFRIYTVFL